MAESKMYDATEVSVSIDGRVVQGFQQNDMVTIQRKEDLVRTSVDAQGTPNVAINNSKLGTIVVNLSGNSVDHKRLNDLAKARKFFPVVVTAPNEKSTANKCIFTKPANIAYGKDTPARTYTIEALDLDMDVLD